MSLLALLGIAKWGRVAALVGVVATSAAGGGFWAGTQWTKGRTAIAEVIDLRADAVALRKAADELRKSSTNAAQDARTASRRMDAIATQHRESTDALNSLFAQQRDAFALQVQSAEAADLRSCNIGAFGLRVWADAAAGRYLSTAGTAGPDTGQPEAGLPADPTQPGERLRPGRDGRVDSGVESVPPMQTGPGKAKSSGDRL